MSKSICFTYEGKEYTLEFNRRSVERMERQGIDVGNLSSFPVTTLPALFHGAFYMHHKGITREQTDKILNQFKKVSGLINRLAEMYNEPIAALVDVDDEDDSKNVEWDASW